MAQWIEQLFTELPLVGVLVSLIILDMFTGMIAAFISKKLCSKISFNGVLKKFQIIAMVATGHIMELVYSEVPWGKVIAFFFCGYELLSITENMARCNVPLPKQLREALKVVSSQYHEEDRSQVDVNVRVDKAEVPSTTGKAVED